MTALLGGATAATAGGATVGWVAAGAGAGGSIGGLVDGLVSNAAARQATGGGGGGSSPQQIAASNNELPRLMGLLSQAFPHKEENQDDPMKLFGGLM